MPSRADVALQRQDLRRSYIPQPAVDVAGADWFASGITSAMALIPECKSHQPYFLLDQLLAGYSLNAPLTDRKKGGCAVDVSGRPTVSWGRV